MDADHWVSGKRTSLDRLRDALLDSREVILRHRTAYNLLIEDVRRVQVAGGTELHLDMSVLAMAAGLLLVLVLHVGVLADRLAEGNLGLLDLDLDVVLAGQFILDDLQVQIAHAVNQGLAVCGVVDRLEGRILGRNLCHRLGDLVDVGLVYRPVAQVGVGLRDVHLGIGDRRRLCGEGISGLYDGELCESPQISCVELGDLCGPVALHDVELADLELVVGAGIVHEVIGLEDTGADFNQAVAADEGVDNGLEHKGGLGL